MTISASRWSLRTDLPHPIPHRAAGFIDTDGREVKP